MEEEVKIDKKHISLFLNEKKNRERFAKISYPSKDCHRLCLSSGWVKAREDV